MADENFTPESADEMAQSTGSKLRAVGRSAGRAIGRAAVKTGKAIAVKVLAILGPTVGGFFLFILFLGLLFMWLFESRGTSGSLSQDPNYENPYIMDNGLPVALGYTKEQALINAYYNYLSTISAQKLFIDPETGEEVWLRFDDPSLTSDYAGLTTEGNQENKFYLSSPFLSMLDEKMHQGAFYYPEQFIKPVFAKALPASGETDGKKYITTIPVIDDGSANAKALMNNMYNGGSDPLYAPGEQYALQPKYLSSSQTNSATLAPLARSAPYLLTDGSVEGNIYATYSGQSDTSSDADKVPGLWDYGFGSIIQYDVGTINRTITSILCQIEIHVHRRDIVELDPETGEVITDPEGDESTFKCYGDRFLVLVAWNDTVDDILAKIDEYNTEYMQVVISPSREQLEQIMSINNVARLLPLTEADEKLAQTVFDNPILNQYFGNSENTTTYPLKVPLISAVATFSGSLRYNYVSQTTRTWGMEEGNMSLEEGLYENCDYLYYYRQEEAGDGDCTFTGDLALYRDGFIEVTRPVAASAEGGISVYGEPLGFTYAEGYLNNYETYIPDTARTDLDFTSRVNTPQEGEYKEELDANGDGELTIMDFISKLGLMKPYDGPEIPGINTAELYAINEFNVAQSVATMRKVADQREEVGFLQSLVNSVSDFLSDIRSQITGLFTFVDTAFGEYTPPSCYYKYSYSPPLEEVYNTAIQAQTFAHQSTYSEESEAFDPNVLDYLLFDSRGVGIGGDQIVSIAQSQIGNVGGETYWRWYGFDTHVDWCACFVSWCANECGFIDSGAIPKFANVGDGYEYFRDSWLWEDNTYTPKPGDIIFFDWDTGSGQDGLLDHVGIVERVDSTTIYTIEGNSSDSCRERSYPIGHYEIAGYGTPIY